MKTLELIAILKSVELRPFDKLDWCGFAGCESKNPMIGETPDHKLW